ncbi:MAG: cold shock domain-containing protein [SAR324 cluster bacterium]|nr:cold shock domain-containing protein [SAR324 cluster bacterium]
MLKIIAGSNIALWAVLTGLGLFYIENLLTLIVSLTTVTLLCGTITAVLLWKIRQTSDAQRYQGTVKWFNPTKGFGFIERDQGEDLFVHQTEIMQEGFRSLNKSDRVEFEIGMGEKGPVAKNVARITPVGQNVATSTIQSVSQAL